MISLLLLKTGKDQHITGLVMGDIDTIERWLKQQILKLKKEGTLERVGGRKNGHWRAIDACIAIKVENFAKKYIINHEHDNDASSFCEIYHSGVMIGNKVACPHSTLVKTFEKKNSIISKVYIIVNVLLGLKGVLSAFNSDIVSVQGSSKVYQRIAESIKNV